MQDLDVNRDLFFAISDGTNILRTAGGAYVATLLSRCMRPWSPGDALGQLQGPIACEPWLGYAPPTPKRAYMPTTTVGTYAPPCCPLPAADAGERH